MEKTDNIPIPFTWAQRLVHDAGVPLHDMALAAYGRITVGSGLYLQPEELVEMFRQGQGGLYASHVPYGEEEEEGKGKKKKIHLLAASTVERAGPLLVVTFTGGLGASLLDLPNMLFNDERTQSGRLYEVLYVHTFSLLHILQLHCPDVQGMFALFRAHGKSEAEREARLACELWMRHALVGAHLWSQTYGEGNRLTGAVCFDWSTGELYGQADKINAALREARSFRRFVYGQ